MATKTTSSLAKRAALVWEGRLWHIKNMPANLMLSKYRPFGEPVASSSTTLTFAIAIRPELDISSVVVLNFELGAKVTYYFRLYRTKKHGNWMKFIKSKAEVAF